MSYDILEWWDNEGKHKYVEDESIVHFVDYAYLNNRNGKILYRVV